MEKGVFNPEYLRASELCALKTSLIAKVSYTYHIRHNHNKDNEIPQLKQNPEK